MFLRTHKCHTPWFVDLHRMFALWECRRCGKLWRVERREFRDQEGKHVWKVWCRFEWAVDPTEPALRKRAH